MPLTSKALRKRAILRSLFAPVTLAEAIARLGFVQADPIRAPARAQDLILRHRVPGYRAGDLEQRYPELSLEEDVLYVYGFLPKANALLLHPRGEADLAGLPGDVLEFVRGRGATHPKDLEGHLGSERAVNAWGGYSKATTRILEALHYRGLLRIVRRQNGIRVYEAAQPLGDLLETDERRRRLIQLVTGILAPVAERSLRVVLNQLRHGAPGLKGWGAAIEGLKKSGLLESGEVDGVTYLWPAGESLPEEVAREVRILAPFDPVVWDRRRTEHLWGWDYRFEAYTPSHKRRYGYYAMPVLWCDRLVGWANLSVQDGSLNADVGYLESAPKGREFKKALDQELARMETFLGCNA